MPDPPVAVFSLPSLSLVELEERAALQTRQDRKYIVGVDTLAQLVDALGDSHAALEIDGRRVFSYDSVYFDTDCLACYRAHVQGRRRRFKVRSRLYVETDRCVFELKLKGSAGETVKHVLAQSPEDHGLLTDPAREFLASHLAPASLQLASLCPCLTTRYRRLTLVSLDGPERLTCDLGLSFEHESGESGAIAEGRVLIETKSATGRSQGDAVLRRLGARPVESLSKYCVGIALSEPGLPTNPFRPLLRRHFHAQSRPASPEPALLAG